MSQANAGTNNLFISIVVRQTTAYFGNAGSLWKMLAVTGRCRQYPASTGTNAGSLLSVFSRNCWKFPAFGECLQLEQSDGRYRRIPENASDCRYLLELFTELTEISRNCRRFPEIYGICWRMLVVAACDGRCWRMPDIVGVSYPV